jgi:hypothetical protein
MDWHVEFPVDALSNQLFMIIDVSPSVQSIPKLLQLTGAHTDFCICRCWRPDSTSQRSCDRVPRFFLPM